MQSEVRHVNSDMLSGVTKTEQTNVRVTVSMACSWRAGRILSRLSCIGVCDGEASRDGTSVMAQGLPRRTIEYEQNASKMPRL